MRHFAHLTDGERDELFLAAPQPVVRTDDRQLLATALGASLYTPCTRRGWAAELLAKRRPEVVSTVLCLEDSIADHEVPAAEAALLAELAELEAADPPLDDLPLLFVRVRSPEHLADIGPRLAGFAPLVAGYVMPKFRTESAGAWFHVLERLESREGHTGLWAMPVLEDQGLVYRETRAIELTALAAVLDAQREKVLAVRIGATDMSGLFGLRRSPEQTVYDLRVIADVIADVVNVLSRPGREFVVTGPVWEYFHADWRLFKPQLRVQPFADEGDVDLRRELIDSSVDGLIREVLLDRANGLTGKTVIHPRHVQVVHALMAVTAEEQRDALAVVGGHGAMRSPTGNKMNEAKPHARWAERTLRRAHAFGVLRPEHNYVALLQAAERVAARS